MSRTTCDVVGLLGLQCRTTTPAPASGGDPPAAQPTTPTTIESSAPPPVTMEPLPPSPPPAQFQPRSYGRTTSSNGYVAHALPSFYASSDPSVLGVTSTAPIEATGGGWRLLGVMWYWWLVTVGGLVLLTWSLGKFLTRRLLNTS